ncbi:hypothetical protein MASR2M15_06540 [Anaerolineales bacterium]
MKQKKLTLDLKLIEQAEEQIVEQSTRIEFYLTEYTVELLAYKLKNDDIEVPAYQREFTWEDKRKSRFLESLIMGLPIPFLFFWENPGTGKLEIVDGSQRIRTIAEFLDNDFELGDLEQLSLLSGFRFEDLPESRQRKIKNRSIRGIVLNEHADAEARFDLFERINTGSKIANPAEVRRGALAGAFQKTIIDLSSDPLFEKLAPVSSKQKKEREREELVIRFFAYGDGFDDYRDKVSLFLFDYTKKMNDNFQQNPKLADEYRDRFLKIMEFVERNFAWGFRKSENGNFTPRARFEAIALGSYLAIKQKPKLVNQTLDVTDWLQSDEFQKIVSSDGANAINRLKNRIYFVRDKLLKA